MHVPQPVGDRLRASAARLVRRGAGPIPAAASTRRIVPSLTRYPGRFKAFWIYDTEAAAVEACRPPAAG